MFPPLLILAGPTASGKTDLAVKLAKKFNGEIINADSRTVYKELNVATAKPPLKSGGFYDGIKHHLFNVVSPKTSYDLAQYQQAAFRVMNIIQRRKKLPILVGGSGLYIRAVIDNLQLPHVPPRPQLRKKLEAIAQTPAGLRYLVKQLKQLDPVAFRTIDKKNPRRVIRALEVCMTTGQPFSQALRKGPPLFDVLYLCLDIPREKLYKRIDARTHQQIKEGLIEETKKLVKKYGLKIPAMSGIGYRQMNEYLQSKMTLPEAILRLQWDTHAYARRQLTWFRKEPRVKWIKNQRQAETLIRHWLNKKLPRIK